MPDALEIAVYAVDQTPAGRTESAYDATIDIGYLITEAGWITQIFDIRFDRRIK